MVRNVKEGLELDRKSYGCLRSFIMVLVMFRMD
jgi:hypothetical protein